MLKRGHDGVYHHFSKKHLGRYVDEFSGRHNSRPLDTDAQLTLLVRLVGKRLTYDTLIGPPPLGNRGCYKEDRGMQSLFPGTEDRTKYLAGNVVCADNVDVLKVLPNSSVDLIYLDPPFNSDTHYAQSLAIRARWTSNSRIFGVDDGDGADLSEIARPCRLTHSRALAGRPNVADGRLLCHSWPGV